MAICFPAEAAGVDPNTLTREQLVARVRELESQLARQRALRGSRESDHPSARRPMALRESAKSFSFDGSGDVATEPQAYDHDDFPASFDRIVGPAFAARESAQHKRSNSALGSFRGALSESERAEQWLRETVDEILDDLAIPDQHRSQLREELLNVRGTKRDMQEHAADYIHAFVRPLAPAKKFDFTGDEYGY